MTNRLDPRHSISDDTELFRTKNDLPAATRAEVVSLLNQRLADCLDLQAMCKQAHWNVKGPNFHALHLLFDQVSESVEEYADLIAERLVQLGGVAEGTVQLVATRSSLPEYPPTLVTGEEHVAALSSALAHFSRSTRIGVAEMEELEDAGSADVLIEVTRGTDKWLWFVEAHEQHEMEAVSTAGGGREGRSRPPLRGNGESAARRGPSNDGRRRHG
jgi:starvation-inducible DNA-binding protein